MTRVKRYVRDASVSIIELNRESSYDHIPKRLSRSFGRTKRNSSGEVNGGPLWASARCQRVRSRNGDEITSSECFHG